ncbi:MAG TPA: hypothetical protein VNC78_08215 [Actinomycetota bacterium]|nr:hypothetical protein [Actinomycetota bacterium]
MKRIIQIGLCILLIALPGASAFAGRHQVRPAAAAGALEQIGHEPLMNRGMNAALAVRGDYAYVGSRTDGLHPNAGLMVVDISDPAAPSVVHQIGPPAAGNIGETTREMRIWPEKELLIVLNLASNCSYLIHECSPTSATMDDVFRFFDISGENAAAPKLVGEYVPSVNPHEFFLWDDPKRPGRALMYMSTPGGGTQLLVTDISRAAEGEFEEIATWTTVIPEQGDNRLHSLSVSNDGTRGFIAYLQGGFFVIDTSQIAKGVPEPKIELVTPLQNRVFWEGPGAHSAVKLYGRPYVVVTDEVYGEIPVLLAGHGCPWGWMRVVDIRNPAAPKVVSEYTLPENNDEFCASLTDNTPDRNTLASYAAHNPTVTKNLVFVTWHAGGVQVVDLHDPAAPTQVAEFKPEPLPAVVTEDPVLSSGRDKVVMWSYPVIQDGLIYVVDVRNGLYILEYSGPYQNEVVGVDFLEGNSNLGDALKMEPVKKR